METYNQNTKTPQPVKDNNRSGRVMGGLFIIALGIIFFAKQAGVVFPYWLKTWQMIPIAIGLYLGFRHNFRGFGWMIPIAIGVVFWISDFYPYLHIHRFIWPVILICIGLYMVFRSGKKGNDPNWKKWDTDFHETSGDDFLDSTVIFGGVKKNIISKKFPWWRGGNSLRGNRNQSYTS